LQDLYNKINNREKEFTIMKIKEIDIYKILPYKFAFTLRVDMIYFIILKNPKDIESELSLYTDSDQIINNYYFKN